MFKNARSTIIKNTIQTFYANQSPPPAYFHYLQNTTKPARSNPNTITINIIQQLFFLQPKSSLLNPITTTYKKKTKRFTFKSLRIIKNNTLII